MMRIISTFQRLAALRPLAILGFAARPEPVLRYIEPRFSSNQRRRRTCFLAGVTAAMLTFIAWTWSVASPPMAGGEATATTAAVTVDVATAQRANIPVYLWGLGNVQAFNTVTVRPQVDGQIIDVAFKEGQEVRAGDLLFKIDSRSHQAIVDQAIARKAQNEAQLKNARRDLERASKLIEKSHVSRQILDATEARVAQFEAAVKSDDAAIASAKVILDYASIRSPLAGRAGMRLVDIGNIVNSNNNSGLVTITQTKPIYVVFTLPETALPQLLTASRHGPMPVAVFSHDRKDQFDAGELHLIDNSVDQTTGTIRLKAIFLNTAGLLWPGQFVSTRLHVTTKEQALTIPANAIQSGPDGNFTYIVTQGGTAEVRKVSVSTTTGGIAVIERGLSDNDIVVTSGQYRLNPGTKVAIKARSTNSAETISQMSERE